MAAAREPALVADIGGTNARFAVVRGTDILQTKSMLVGDFSDPIAAIRGFLESCPPALRPRRAALAFAGPVEGGEARLTNGSWRIAVPELCEQLDLVTAKLVNDFTAVAGSVPRLGAEHLVAVGGGAARPGAPYAAIGPGTGLGVALAVPGPAGPVILATEGGHVTMAPVDRREAALLEHLRARFGHVSAERVLSGDGLENLYRSILAVDGLAEPPRPAEEIVARALAGDCPASAAALESFCAMLGTVAGNLALSLGAQGGIYIAGGIVPRFLDYFVASGFRRRFEAKGRFAGYLARIPSFVIVHPTPALVGLAALLETA